ncbi:MAG: peptide deformylase [Chlamydiales bacterium]|nr:peptide deformylase [Chlamydiales bacterium]
MKLPLHYYGSKILRMKAAPITEITPEIRQLAYDMIETMNSMKAIGLAANQVGQLVTIFVSTVEPDGSSQFGPNRIYINPRIVWYSSEKQYEQEGCMSIPKTYVYVERPMKMGIEAQDLDGNTFELELEGLGASNFCHENDHLNGVLHIDRIDPKQRREIEAKLKAIKKAYS